MKGLENEPLYKQRKYNDMFPRGSDKESVKFTGCYKYVEVPGAFTDSGDKIYKRKRVFQKNTRVKKYLSAE